MFERAFGLTLAIAGFLFFALFAGLGFFLFGDFGPLANAVTDEAHSIEPRHILLLEEVDGITFAFGKQCNEHICARDFVAPGRLDMQNRALHNPLKAAGWRRIAFAIQFQRFELAIEIMGNRGFQLTQISAARDHDFCCMLIIDERVEQMLQRCIFMLAGGGGCERIVQRGFQFTGKRRHIGSFTPYVGIIAPNIKSAFE